MLFQLVQIFKTLTSRERLIFMAAFSIFLITASFLLVELIEQKTTAIPVSGGEYVEGIIGQPSFINPVLIGNNEVDRDLVKLIFDDLLDLAEKYKVSDDGKIWTVRFKENIFWHDGQPITSDDVVFTVKTIQDPDANSPLAPNWLGVIIERVSEREIKFILPTPYAFFDDVLKNLYPIPKHIFADIPPANLKLSNYNLEPVGSGKFKYVSAEKRRDGFITEYRLARNDNYYGQKPYLEQFNLDFFSDEKDLINAFNSGKISGFAGINPKKLSQIKINHRVNSLIMPRYYAIFLNQSASDALKNPNVRLALDYAVDRKNIIEKVFDNWAINVNGPLVIGTEGFNADISPVNDFSPEKAEQLLNDSGWLLNNGVREKTVDKKTTQTTQLKINLTVPNLPFMVETANLLRENWAKIGVELNLIVSPLSDINQEAIKTRNYEAILFGNNIGRNPDLFSFWHSSERFYPGLNLSLYENKAVDNLIESIRKDFNKETRVQKLFSVQSLIANDKPAIFLYSPNYLYITKNDVKGFENKYIYLDSDRFENVEKWYIKTARVFK